MLSPMLARSRKLSAKRGESQPSTSTGSVDGMELDSNTPVTGSYVEYGIAEVTMVIATCATRKNDEYQPKGVASKRGMLR
jgi:hypothetical protein